MASGDAGEKYFIRFIAPKMAWQMTRAQQAMRCVGTDYQRRPIYQPIKGGAGVADFTGWNSEAEYIACECKEAEGDSMPYSRLRDQRAFMDSVPTGHAFVFVLWRHPGSWGEVFPYHAGSARGAYGRGRGI